MAERGPCAARARRRRYRRSAGEIESGVKLRRSDGSAIYGYEARAIDERYGAPLVGIHRADLLEGLLRALGEDVVRFGVGARAPATASST